MTKEDEYNSKNFKNEKNLFEFLLKKLRLIKNSKNIIISGGSSLKNLYKKISICGCSNFYLSDERLVSPRSVLSNYKRLTKYFKNKLRWPTENLLNKEPKEILYISNSNFKINPNKSIAIISVAEDGHICSIFNKYIYSLNQTKNFYLVKRRDENFFRITLSLNFLKKISLIFIIINGKNKKMIYEKICDSNKNLPIRYLNKKKIIILTCIN